MKLVECVPNFSEGRDPAVIDRIAEAIRAVSGATLLDVDPGADTNRTVMTMVGPPEAVLEAAFQAIRQAAVLIDMHKHTGAHPRMGATDVCPFVPVADMSMQECVELARQLGERVGSELAIPVYLYERAASRAERQNLADIRKGEYEGLVEKLKDPHWAPDYGPSVANMRAGATVIGAREFLIAFNVNLNTRDKKAAHDIALELREQGRFLRDEAQKFVRDENGEKVRKTGLFKDVKAVGWVIEEYGCAQISMNLTNYNVSAPHVVFDKACELAWSRGLRVTGSELVGLIPKDAIVEAGRYYQRKQGLSAGVSDDELIAVAVRSMGLSELSVFKPEEKIIEYRTQPRCGRLMQQDGRAFVEELASDSPAPGGGSVAALAGAFCAALSAMVAGLTFGKKGYEKHNGDMERIGIEAHACKDVLVTAVDTDAAAFDAVMDAMRLPRNSDEEIASRERAVQAANQAATLVPMATLRAVLRPIQLAYDVADCGNQNSLSDAGVAGLMGRAAAEGAYYNVLINLKSVSDAEFCETTKKQANALLQECYSAADRVQQLVLERLKA